MPTATDETAEAINGALHYNEFDHVGEQHVRGFDLVPRLWTYWCVGYPPQDLRVIVKRDEPFVVVTVNWRIISTKIVKAAIDFRIDCDPNIPRSKLEDSTQAVIMRLLEMYRDVLEGTGYASVGYLAANRKR